MIARVTSETIIVTRPFFFRTTLLEAGVVVETANAEGCLGFIVLVVFEEGITPGVSQVGKGSSWAFLVI